MSQDLEPRQFKAAGFVKVNVCKSLIDAKKDVWSSSFSCPDDPHPPEFKIKLKFGGVEPEISLSFFVINVSKRVVIFRGLRITLCDEDLKILNQGKGVVVKNPSRAPNCGLGFPSMEFFPPPNVSSGDREWNVICSVVYDGVLVNTKFPNECSCENGLSKDLLKLLESGKDADVTLVVGEETMKAHKNILKTRSTYFQKMFDCGMKESLTNRAELEDVDPATFKEVLKFLYSGLPPEHLPNSAMELFSLADRFGIPELKSMCSTAIHGILSAENVVDALIMADQHNAEDLKDMCTPVFRKNMKEIRQSGESWNRLSEHPRIFLPLMASFFD